MSSNDATQHEDVKIDHMEIKLKINMTIHLRSPWDMVTIINIWNTNKHIFNHKGQSTHLNNAISLNYCLYIYLRKITFFFNLSFVTTNIISTTILVTFVILWNNVNIVGAWKMIQKEYTLCLATFSNTLIIKGNEYGFFWWWHLSDKK